MKKFAIAASVFAAGTLVAAAAVAQTPMSGSGAGSPTFGNSSLSCKGINACKGQSACKSATNACKGQNACNGQGWLDAKSRLDCQGAGGTPAQF